MSNDWVLSPNIGSMTTLSYHFLFNIMLEAYSFNEVRKRNEKFRLQERSKANLYSQMMWPLCRKSYRIYKKTTRYNTWVLQGCRQQDTYTKSTAFLCTSNEKSEIEILKIYNGIKKPEILRGKSDKWCVRLVY